MPPKLEVQLIEVITTYRMIENRKYAPGLTPQALLEAISKNVEQNAEAAAKYNELLHTLRKNLLNEDPDRLLTLAQRLSTKNPGSNSGLDMGLALEIHKALLTRARAANDTNRILPNLYWIGIILHTTDDTYFAKDTLAYFNEGAQYRHKYFEIPGRNARSYIHRCLGNTYVAKAASRHILKDPKATEKMFIKIMHDFFETVDEALEFWAREDIRKKDPDLPWQLYINNAHQNVCVWIDVLRSRKLSEETTAYLTNKIIISHQYLLENSNHLSENALWPKTRFKYMDIALKCHTGKASPAETIAALDALLENADPTDYTPEGMYMMVWLPSIITEFHEFFANVTRKELQKHKHKFVGSVLKYLKNAPRYADKQFINSQIFRFGKSLVESAGTQDYIDLMLKLTTFNHLPTYAHSLMVAKITTIIARWFLKNAPYNFGPLLNKKSHEDVLEIARMAALCHDIGKVSFASTVGLSIRTLYDFEIEILKQHPLAAEKMTTTDETFEAIKAAIMGHHKYYSGQTGYPASHSHNPKYAFLVDIITIADSIDAATDSIGRTFARTKTPDDIMREIYNQPQRYSPTIAQALQYVQKEIKTCLTEGRLEAYYKAYLNIYGE